ncbi:MAG: peptide antibiotic transporter SbmA [Granulosicoccaceae bacterium]
MFRSFFPSPKLFFLSAFGWFLFVLAVWHGYADTLGPRMAIVAPLELTPGENPPFMNQDKAWVYVYLIMSALLFCIAWIFYGRNRWYNWSVIGTAIILLVTYFLVQISVWFNTWYRDFFDLIQLALTEPDKVSSADFYGQLSTALYILIPVILARVLFSYYTSHYVFRWRTAMNNYYMANWKKLRHVEGAAQRVQEDTMRFAGIVEGLGSAFISSIMTLLAFLPVLWTLSEKITELPLVGPVEGSMVFVALMSAIFGTILLAIVGMKLPGLEFHNQRVEAAYRKELVYGEDFADRAAPPTVQSLFSDVRTNYFRLYFNYLYFNVFRYAYLQGASFVPLVALGPTIVTGAITFGFFQQIRNAFSQVENSFQFLVNSWTTIVELISIHKRLTAFESVIEGDEEMAISA